MGLKCGNCGSTKLKNMRENGFVNKILDGDKTIEDPAIYYCWNCGCWSSEEKIHEVKM